MVLMIKSKVAPKIIMNIITSNTEEVINMLTSKLFTCKASIQGEKIIESVSQLFSIQTLGYFWKVPDDIYDCPINVFYKTF